MTDILFWFKKRKEKRKVKITSLQKKQTGHHLSNEPTPE